MAGAGCSASAGPCRMAIVQPLQAPDYPFMDWQRLATSLMLPLLEGGIAPRLDARCDVYLSADATGPYLQLTGRQAPGPVRCSLYDPAMAHRRRGGQNELLGRAVGVHRRSALRVVDTTAGFAADACVLADLGACVLICEQHPLLAALLDLSMQHLVANPGDWRHPVVSRMSLRSGDSRSLSPAELTAQDVLYLDPMFPSGRRAASGKGMALLQQLLSAAPGGSAESLLQWALAQPVRRVVVKRPLKAPLLCGLQPSHALVGRSVRFDVYQLDGGSRNAT